MKHKTLKGGMDPSLMARTLVSKKKGTSTSSNANRKKKAKRVTKVQALVRRRKVQKKYPKGTFKKMANENKKLKGEGRMARKENAHLKILMQRRGHARFLKKNPTLTKHQKNSLDFFMKTNRMKSRRDSYKIEQMEPVKEEYYRTQRKGEKRVRSDDEYEDIKRRRSEALQKRRDQDRKKRSRAQMLAKKAKKRNKYKKDKN